MRKDKNRPRAAPYQRQQVGGGLAAGSKILVTHLDPQVGEEDVADIFANVGPVQKAVVHYDRDGRSLGTAEVTFARKNDAIKAVEEYDGAEVDGRAMYLKVIATKAPTVVVQSRPQQRQQQRPMQGNFVKGGRGKGAKGAKGKTQRGGGRGGRGRGAKGGRGRGGKGGKGKEDKKPVSAEALDAEMDTYFSATSESTEDKKAATGQPAAPAAE